MPFLIVLELALQIICVTHVIKTGRERWWIYIILLAPFLGSIFYFFFEMLPDLRQSREGRMIAKKILKTIDPQRDLKRLAKELEISDNVENKLNLADECVTAGFYAEAATLYESTLKGIYEHDPVILLKLATALFYKEDFAKTKEMLNRLIANNPEFKSLEGHLLFARTLEALQDNEAALAEYAVLASYYSGYEAKCRYALFLKKLGHTEKANKLFDEILQQADKLPKTMRKMQKTWIEIASQQKG